VIRVYYPPDFQLSSQRIRPLPAEPHYVNVVTCGKQPQLQWLNMDERLEHCSRGASTWKLLQR